jgi:hypothetical protein
MDERWDRESVGEYERSLCEEMSESYEFCQTLRESSGTRAEETEELDLSEYVCNACL